jgi:magnesium-protoporphyrin IX monomethyl ester (oxidative) cyclase
MLKVTLVVPPMLSVARPSIGIGAIKASLRNIDCDVAVQYAALEFANFIGPELNQLLAEQTDHRLLIGDWIFSGTLYGDRGDTDREYIDKLLRPQLSPDLIESILEVRAKVGGFVAGCASRIVASGADIVGFTSTFQQHVAALSIAKVVKAMSPNVVVCMGGANCEDDMGRATLELFPFVDHVFSGESDATFPQFVSAMVGDEAGPPYPVSRRQFVEPGDAPAITDLDDLPVPDFADYFEQLKTFEYGERVNPALAFEASRGCWWGAKHHCTFCGLNGSSMAYRSKSPARVLSEIFELSERWSVTAFSPSDNILAPKHIDEVFGRMPSGSSLRFFYEIKSNMSHEQIGVIARGGVTWLQPGIESLCGDVLKLMNKGVSPLLNIRFLRSCVEIGVVPLWNYLVGFPGEDDSEYEEVTSLIPYLEHLYPPQNGPTFIRVDRFSPYHNGTASINFDSIRPLDAYPYVHPLDDHQLSRLAYFFQGTSSRLISEPVRERLTSAIRKWRTRFWDRENPAILASVAFGDVTLVRDTRSVAREPVTLLAPEEAAILGYARSPVSLEVLYTKYPGSSVNHLVELGYLVRSGAQAMSVVKEFGWQVRSAEEILEQPCGSLSPGQVPSVVDTQGAPA